LVLQYGKVALGLTTSFALRPEPAAIRAWFAQENPYIQLRAGVYRPAFKRRAAPDCEGGLAQVEGADIAAKTQGIQRL